MACPRAKMQNPQQLNSSIFVTTGPHRHDGDKQGQVQNPHLCHIHNSRSSTQSPMVITMVENEAVLVTKKYFAKVDVSNKMIKPVKYEHVEIF